MRRSRTESPSSSGGDPATLAAKCGIETQAYTFDNGEWSMPDASRIASDLRRCGGSIPIFLTILLPDATSEEKTIFLGVLLMVVREDMEAHEQFKKAREAAEEVSLIRIHDQLYKTAESGDVPSMKFLLERRFKTLFGKDAKAIDDNEDWIKKETERLANLR
jgi:hypothetical protein